MRSHHPVSCFFIAYSTGYHHIAPVNPNPHIPSRYEERITVVAVLAAQITVYPHPLAHRDQPGKNHVTVAQFRVVTECKSCLVE